MVLHDMRTVTLFPSPPPPPSICTVHCTVHNYWLAFKLLLVNYLSFIGNMVQEVGPAILTVLQLDHAHSSIKEYSQSIPLINISINTPINPTLTLY